MRCGVYDAPITAITCSSSGGDVYFASGNTVYWSEMASLSCSPTKGSHAAFASARFATAPLGTSITSLEVAHTSLNVPIVFMGAADHVLGQYGVDSDLSTSVCRTIFRSDGERVLRIVVDAQKGFVCVLTAANNLFYGVLDRIVAALRAHTTSGHHDVPLCCPLTRVGGPLLGVVLAADGLVRHSFSPDGHEGTPKTAAEKMTGASCHFFSATYTGEIVEWRAFLGDEGVGVARTAPLETYRQSAVTCMVVSRVQAHPSGCAIFAVRVTDVTAESCGFANTWDDTTSLARTYLVSCSDDRSVALYERQCSMTRSRDCSEKGAGVQESGWVLLWRGCGAGFVRSRIFDVALHAAWWPQAPESGERPWRGCAVYVGVAGEDGSVQVIEVSHGEDDDLAARPQCSGAHSGRSKGLATPRLVRLHQHRGHGAYRVAFSRATPRSVMLISGGFDGAVFAHALQSALKRESGEDSGSMQLQVDAVMREPPIVATAKICEGVATDGGGNVLQPCPTLSASARKIEQVRAVHVDGDGLLLACTGRALCVKSCDASSRSWWIALPVNGLQQRCGGARNVPALDWGIPATLESVVARFRAPSVRGSSRASVGCALVGTTTGVLRVVPYSYFRAKLDRCLPVAAFAAPQTGRPSEWGLLVTSALHSFGKITQISALPVPDSNTSSTTDSVSDDSDAAVRSSTEATICEFIVATNHLRDTIVLSRLRLMLSHASPGKEHSGACGWSVELCASTVWQTLVVYSDGPGSLTTALSLVHILSGQQSACNGKGDSCATVKGGAVLSLWLFVGDRNGCLLGTRNDVMSSFLESTSDPLHLQTPPPAISLRAVACIHRYVFAEHLHLAISAICTEECHLASAVGSACVPSTILITVAGTGGVVGYVYADLSPSAYRDDAAVGASPLPMCAKKPLRLPFEVSSVLSVSPSLWVVQCGTTVSVLHRIPGRASWVPVGSCDGVRAPRLLAARVVSGSSTSGPLALFAHCSDGQTVERMIVQTGRAALMQNRLPLSGSQTALLHGRGFPGKDYNCVAYAPAPLDCLLMGNEDCSLVLFPIRATSAAIEVPHVHLPPSGLLAPLNVCGTHHSNILALAVLPRSEASALWFVSVGGGAMVNLWSAAQTSSPLELLDWWCGGGASSRQNTTKSEPSSVSVTDINGDAVPYAPRISSARFHRRRAKRGVAVPASLTLTDRMPRYMAVTAVSSTEVAVGSSDGTVLFFEIQKGRGVGGSTLQSTTATLQLRWQGVLNAERARPIMCMGSSHGGDHSASTCTANIDRTPPLVLAGDTNGVVYVVDAVSHTVRSQTRLEQSCVNAISELQRIPTTSLSHAEATIHEWRFAALHDSGVVHLMALEVSEVHGGDVLTAELRLLWSASTGLTAGRSVHWPALSLPLVVVTEEHFIEFEPEAAQRGELRRSFSQRVSVRCVSGAAVVSEAPRDGHVPTRLRVAIVGQGFELVG
ncbi:hypothetical protein JKF63_00798 [Porcisia hertigi]|uniref:Uncharacterized protein n=1 Tax=Porcisia hertigi TaxID=2761500 RepID=A0A836I5I5_9TRYP|nr:hypothetical protein JKF63_00798 [Porcisia hertigi]